MFIFLVIPDIGNRESILVSFGWSHISYCHCAVDSVDNSINQYDNQAEVCGQGSYAMSVSMIKRPVPLLKGSVICQTLKKK